MNRGDIRVFNPVEKTTTGAAGSWRGTGETARPSMPSGFVLCGNDFAYVGLVAAIASARHPCPRTDNLTFHPKHDRGGFHRPTLYQNKWDSFYPSLALSMFLPRWQARPRPVG